MFALMKPDMADQKKQMESMAVSIDDLKATLSFFADSVEDMRKELIVAQKEVKSLHQIREEVRTVRSKNKVLTDRLNNLEDYSRRDNMVISGIAENLGEDCREICASLFKNVFDMKNVEVVRAHRLGSNTVRNRKLIVRVKYFEDKQKIMKNRKILKEKNPGVYIDDDFSPETLRKRQNLRPVLKQLC